MTADTAGQSEDGFTFNDVLVMFLVDIVIYSILAWYAGHVGAAPVFVAPPSDVVRSATQELPSSGLATRDRLVS